MDKGQLDLVGIQVFSDPGLARDSVNSLLNGLQESVKSDSTLDYLLAYLSLFLVGYCDIGSNYLQQLVFVLPFYYSL